MDDTIRERLDRAIADIESAQATVASVFYAANEATPDDEAEEDRIIEEAQAKAARNETPARSRIVDLTLTDGVWKE